MMSYAATNPALVKALLALVPACMLFSGSIVQFLRERTPALFFQFLGAACLMLVVLTHVAEAFQWVPWMHWGDDQSIGHYVDVASGVLGIALFPLGYLLHALSCSKLAGMPASSKLDGTRRSGPQRRLNCDVRSNAPPVGAG